MPSGPLPVVRQMEPTEQMHSLGRGIAKEAGKQSSVACCMLRVACRSVTYMQEAGKQIQKQILSLTSGTTEVRTLAEPHISPLLGLGP